MIALFLLGSKYHIVACFMVHSCTVHKLNDIAVAEGKQWGVLIPEMFDMRRYNL